MISRNTLTIIVVLCLVFTLSSSALLDEWQKWKFGLFMHWGPYSILADDNLSNEASWPINWSSREWSNPNMRTKEEMVQYRKYYFGLSRRFHPSKFDPSVWSKLAYNAGMRYVVMTTKHHDGFSMFNTSLDEYSVVGSECPYKRDIYGEVVKEFRRQGMGVGAYFSKVDWHRKDFWKEEPFPDTKYTNYNPLEEPKLWESFRNFTQGQVAEIVRQYKPDLLWFDGSWAKPKYMDVGMIEIAKDARKVLGDVIIVNRGAQMFEDYLTPEQEGIPQAPLVKPWELCMTIGKHWSYEKNDTYKSAMDIITTLLTVVSRGGNLLLNIPPRSDGTFDDIPVQRLKEIAHWMSLYGEGIHNTVPQDPYYYDIMESPEEYKKFFFTRRDNSIYIYTIQVNISNDFTIPLSALKGKKIKSVRLLGASYDLQHEFNDEDSLLTVQLPKVVTSSSEEKIFAFKVTTDTQ